jgi:hypothetical protein
MTSYKLNPEKRRFASVYKNLMRRCYPYDTQEKKSLSRMCSRRGFPHRRFNLGLQDLNNPKNGGMVDEWLRSRNSFIYWCQVQNPPAGYCLERIDLSKPYGPDNCQFIPPNEKYRKLSTNNWVEYKGQRMILSDLIKNHSLVSRAAVQDRLRRGFSLEEALTMPSRKKSKNYIEQLKENKDKKEAARIIEADYRQEWQEITESVYLISKKVSMLDRNWKMVVKKANKVEVGMEKQVVEECNKAFWETEPINSEIGSLVTDIGRLFQNWPKLRPWSVTLFLATVMITLMKRRGQLLACIENTKNNEEALIRYRINLRTWAVAVPTYAE